MRRQSRNGNGAQQATASINFKMVVTGKGRVGGGALEIISKGVNQGSKSSRFFKQRF